MPRPSSRSAGASYLDKEARIAAVRRSAERAVERMPEIRRIVLFGSLAIGIPTPASDADLWIEVASSSYEHPRDRIPDVLEALSPLPCAVDLFIHTAEEIERMRSTGSGLLRAASAGLTLFER